MFFWRHGVAFVTHVGHARCDTGVCEQINTSPDKKTLGSVGLKNTKSGGGDQFLLLDCRATARRKGVSSFTGTGII